MRSYRRPVRFEEVDAAAIVFFARYLNICHEAMESFFDELAGGYAGLILGRKVGLPAVRADAEYTAPARYGDVLVVEIGRASCRERV